MTTADTTSLPGLTGLWRGHYTHDHGTRRTAFSLTLEQRGTELSGLVEEYAGAADGGSQLQFARVVGRREGNAILFAKTYTGRSGWDHTIEYEGEVAPEGASISGTWRLSATWVGTFEMRRTAPVK